MFVVFFSINKMQLLKNENNFFYVVFICEETELIDLMGNWLTNSLIHVYQGVCPPQEGAVQSFGGLYSSERLENV